MDVFSDLYLNYLGPKHHFKKPILWPVWIWTLHVPEARRGGLNLLARTVLRLHDVGCTDPLWISDHIGIDADLVRYIVHAELIRNGLLDKRLRITTAGKCKLIDDSDNQSQRAVLMFQSAESDKLWPRQQGLLSEIDAIDYTDRFPRFLLDRNSGYTMNPFHLLPPSQSVKNRPTEEEFLNALRQDYVDRRLDRHRRFAEYDPTSQGIFNIEYSDPRPRPAWVLCDVFINRRSDPPWLASDPLGVARAAPWMRKEVYEASRRVPALAKFLGGLLGQGGDNVDWETYRRHEDEKVRFEIFERFPNVNRIPQLEDRLVELLRSRSTVEKAARSARSEEIGTVTIQGQRTLEQCMLWALKHWPLEHPENRLSRTMKEQDLQHALRCAVPTLPDRFIQELRVKPEKVFGALKYRTGSLRQYLAGILLSLVDHRTHPFHPIATDECLMLQILELSQERDAAGHGGNISHSPDDYIQALRHADTVINVVTRLIEGIPENGEE